MVIVAGHSQSQWRISWTLRQQFTQIGSSDGSSPLRYCLREGWWLDRRREIRMSSFLLLICFASQETLRCWEITAKCSYVGWASQIVSLITWMELEKRNRKNCVCGNGGGFFGCFVSYIITWNGRMARDPLNEDGRWYGVDGIVSWGGSRIWWNVSFM